MKKVKIKIEFLDEVEKNRNRLKKSYIERVKERMGEYYDKKTMEKTIKIF